MTTTAIDAEYRRRIAAMTPKERLARTAAMLAWTRRQMAARIRKEQPGLSGERLRWEVALRMYESESEVVAMIKRHLANVESNSRNQLPRASDVNTLSETICRMTGTRSVELGEEIQSLWSGYGVIRRATLHGLNDVDGEDPVHVVIKHIDLSRARSNRRGWGGDLSHQRKVRSYQVETTFYERFANRCDRSCQVPNLVAAHEIENDGGWVMVLTDLDSLGFDRRKGHVGTQAIHACLTWLAHFHATFLGDAGDGLWPVGTYWHLETRPDELAAMPDGPLKQSARRIDKHLNQATYQTLVHGDAKVANFCFSHQDRDRVAAVDFQYVGRGCGMKDVAYFISSCLSEEEAAEQQDSLLEFYFGRLQEAASVRRLGIDFSALKSEWLDLYPFAWADFSRFLSGWSPGHWKLNTYSDSITRSVLKEFGF